MRQQVSRTSSFLPKLKRSTSRFQFKGFWFRTRFKAREMEVPAGVFSQLQLLSATSVQTRAWLIITPAIQWGVFLKRMTGTWPQTASSRDPDPSFFSGRISSSDWGFCWKTCSPFLYLKKPEGTSRSSPKRLYKISWIIIGSRHKLRATCLTLFPWTPNHLAFSLSISGTFVTKSDKIL